MQSQKQGKTQMLKNQATFNDGICDIYTVQNAAAPGDMPVNKLFGKQRVRFAYRTVGAVRFYMAKAANVDIDRTIVIPRGIRVSPQDVVIITTERGEEEQQYEVMQVQIKTDTMPQTVLLTLKRRAERYDIAGIS